MVQNVSFQHRLNSIQMKYFFYSLPEKKVY